MCLVILTLQGKFLVHMENNLAETLKDYVKNI
jgi:hypothetical protein